MSDARDEGALWSAIARISIPVPVLSLKRVHDEVVDVAIQDQVRNDTLGDSIEPVDSLQVGVDADTPAFCCGKFRPQLMIIPIKCIHGREGGTQLESEAGRGLQTSHESKADRMRSQ